MKKKLLGMVFVLVVMMIIPLAIGAADAPTLSVTGSIDKTTGAVTTVADGDTLNIVVAVDGKATLSVKNVPSGEKISEVSVTFNKGGDQNTGYTQNGNSITITGNTAHTGTQKTVINVTVAWKETVEGNPTPQQKSKNLVCNVTVVPKAITSFTLTGTVNTLVNGEPTARPNVTMENNIDLYVGDTFTVTSGTVKFNSGESKNGLAANLFTPVTTSFTAGQSGVKYTLTLDDPNPKRAETHTKEQSYTIHVVARETEVKVEKNPNYDKFVAVYDAGTLFDFNSIRLAVYYKNTTALQDYAYYNDAQGFKADPVTMQVGQDSFTIIYNNEPHTFKFSDLGITTVAAKTIEPYIKEGGKTTYYYGDKFDFDDLELDVVEVGLTGNKTYTVTSKGFTAVKPTGRITADDTGITITYDTKSYTWTWAKLKTRDNVKFQVLPDNRTLVGIEATGTPLVKDYTEGQTVKDWSGLTFYAIYNIYNGSDGTNTEVKKVLSEDEVKNVKALICEYSKYDPKKNTYIVVEYTEGETTVRGDVYGFNITGKKVESIKVTTPPTKTKYENGDKLNLDGMKITVYYTNGTSEVHSYADPNFTCTPAHGDTVSPTTRGVTVVYKDGDITAEDTWNGFSIDSTVKIKRVTISIKPDKMVYEVGERFDPTGIEITVIFADKNTPDAILTAKDLTSISKTFSSTKDNKVEIPIQNTADKNDVHTVTLEVTVKEKVVPSSIDNVSYKLSYLAGEVASLADDITDYTVTLSDGTKLSKSDVDKLVKNNLATVTLTPTYTLQTSTKKLTLSLSYKGVTVTKDLSIEVTTPACVLTTSGGSEGALFVPYETLELALEAANALTTSEAKSVTITLSKDVELAEKYQFNAERTIGIDLNGYDILMAQNQLIVPHKSTHKNVEIILLNTSSTDSTIKYDKDDKDLWIILSKGDELVIDWETEVPGIYEITLEVGEHGTVTGPTDVAHGNDAKYTITPDEGYEVDQIYVDSKAKGKGDSITIEGVASNHTITVTFTKIIVEWVNPFKDVSKYASYYEAIEFVYENDLFKGVSDTEFEPRETMTRAMFVTVLGRLAGIEEDDPRYAGKSTFSDVKYSAKTSWYVTYVAWATETGLLLGYEDGTFRPDNEISHTEMYILMERYARKILGVDTSVVNTRVTVADEADIPTWEGAYEAVQFATKFNFLVKTSNKIKPNDDALRHELATLLMSFCTEFELFADDEE